MFSVDRAKAKPMAKLLVGDFELGGGSQEIRDVLNESRGLFSALSRPGAAPIRRYAAMSRMNVAMEELEEAVPRRLERGRVPKPRKTPANQIASLVLPPVSGNQSNGKCGLKRSILGKSILLSVNSPLVVHIRVADNVSNVCGVRCLCHIRKSLSQLVSVARREWIPESLPIVPHKVRWRLEGCETGLQVFDVLFWFYFGFLNIPWWPLRRFNGFACVKGSPFYSATLNIPVLDKWHRPSQEVQV
ncbi:hypothetical protein C8F04DRAFT_1294937 [Mycena alexandri]|uniref:Uncharacterized protein n=1 Tax=Mycena alexandri TaxID=1745969 RepID=A0AAD6WXK0_9AGAR|nr:hypothetical protein C8F04DRAFT_1294937 [Mycena alexandri]